MSHRPRLPRARAPRGLRSPLRWIAPAVAAFAAAGGCAGSREPATIAVSLERGAAASAPQVAWTTDRGFQVRVDEAYFVSHTVELVPCKTAFAPLDRLVDPFRAREAHAGHVIDPSTEPLRLRTMHAESLLSAAPTLMGTLRPPPASYCGAFYLVARAMPGTALGDAPAGVDLPGRKLSAFVRGAWQRSPSSDWTAFTGETSSAYGQNVNAGGVVASLAGPPSLEVRPGAKLALRFQHDTSKLFDGIDFAAETPENIGRRVLTRWVDGTRVTLEPR